MLEAGVAGQVFPGAAAALAWRRAGGAGGTAVVSGAAGRLFPGGPEARPDTYYDLGAVTMPIVATAALRLVAAGRVSLDLRADEVLSDVRGGPAGDATLGALLAHRAGLAVWGGLYLDVPHDIGTPAARRWLVAEAARRPDDEPDGPPRPSDLGYLIAGEMIARAAGEPLDRVVAREVAEPLGLDEHLLYPSALVPERRVQVMRRSAPTERCEWRGRVVRGEAHDENCAALGGVAGHAGLFGTAEGVARFGAACLAALLEESAFLPRRLMQLAIGGGAEGPLRTGWRTPAGPDEVGRRLGANAFGQVSLTGTSLWIDPDRGLSVALLTNRIHPSRANRKIEGFRPAFHDSVLAAHDGA